MRRVKGRWVTYVVQNMRINTIQLVQAKIHELYRSEKDRGEYTADVELEWAKLTLQYPRLANADLELVGALQPSSISLDKGQCLWIEQLEEPGSDRQKTLNLATDRKELLSTAQ